MYSSWYRLTSMVYVYGVAYTVIHLLVVDSGVERLADQSNKLLLRCARALRDSSHG